MSPVFLNVVVDVFMNNIDSSIGVTTGEMQLCSQMRSVVLNRHRNDAETTGDGNAKFGLIMNPRKCTSMRTEIISKRKQWIDDNPAMFPKIFFQLCMYSKKTKCQSPMLIKPNKVRFQNRGARVMKTMVLPWNKSGR